MIKVASATRILGPYALHGELAGGGMATVHLGRVREGAGVGRTVAIKRLRPEFGSDPGFVAAFVAEALRAARVRHPNVVLTLDVLTDRGEDDGEEETFLVMEYVEGESLARLLRALRERKRRVPPRIAQAILSGVLHGLHAAHETRGEDGAPLGIVHRDVSPQNVIVGTDGSAHLVDFGISSATGEMHTTRAWRTEAKLGYMSPEGLASGTFTPRSDVYSAAVVLWETLTLRRLFEADTQGELMVQVASGDVVAPGALVAGLSRELDAIVLRGLARDPAMRWGTAAELARALDQTGPGAEPGEVAEWVRSLASNTLALRARLVAELEAASEPLPPAPVSEAPRSVGEPVSQGFTLTSAERRGLAPPPRVGKSYSLLLAGGLAGLLVAASPLLLFLRDPGQATSAPPPGEVTPAPPGDPVAPSLRPPVPPSTGGTAESPPPSAAAEVPGSKPGNTVPASRVAQPRQSIPRPAAKGVADCDPPFTRDALGHKHFKLQCL